MTWAEALKDPSLNDLPYKVELNGHGQLVLTPVPNWVGILKGRIIGALYPLRGKPTQGHLFSRLSIATSDNVKVSDIAWASKKLIALYKFATPFPVAPELCIEINHSSAEMALRRAWYFGSGAHEVWKCSKSGRVKFYDITGEIPRSRLFRKFPKQVD